jgi:redox-sensitive bicupin YhaK (pirin superfamily)
MSAPRDGLEILQPREVPLGGTRAMTVRRTLPHKEIRTVGAWCFVDDYGPDDLSTRPGMDVPPHPHTGLQTVTWLVRGQVLHHDSVGSTATIEPGQLNLMTAGHGIAHSEQSVHAEQSQGRFLHGVQLWVALPDSSREQDPHFEHHDDLPQVTRDGADVVVIVGALAGERSPAATYSPIVGAQVRLEPAGRTRLDLDPAFEHAVLVLDAAVGIDGTACEAGPLVYLRPGRDGMTLAAGPDGALLLLLGGAPLSEDLLMWWNFVGRTHEEIVTMREDWAAGRRFGTVSAYPGAPLPAPAMPTTRLLPRASRLPRYP